MALANKLKSVWSWLAIMLGIILVAYLAFRVQVNSAGKVTATILDVPTSNYALTKRGFIDVAGGLKQLPSIDGVVEKALISEGDLVEAGQKLIVFESRKEQLDLELARLKLQEAQIQLSMMERDQSRASDPSQKLLEIELQEILIRQAEINLEDASRILAQKTLIAPIDGVVTKINVALGAQTSQTDSPAIIISPNQTKIIDLALLEHEAKAVFEGQLVEVASLSDQAKVVIGRVAGIDSAYDSISKTGESAANELARLGVTVQIEESADFRLGQEVLLKFKGESSEEKQSDP